MAEDKRCFSVLERGAISTYSIVHCVQERTCEDLIDIFRNFRFRFTRML